MNKIAKIYDKTDWRPSFYFLAMPPTSDEAPDELSGKNYITRNINNETICFLNSSYKGKINNTNNVYFYDMFSLWGTNPFDNAAMEDVYEMPTEQLEEFWSDLAHYHIYYYHTMYGAIQLAAYMGFDEIYLLGCDLGMDYVDPHMIFEMGLDPYKYDGGKWSYLREAYERGFLPESVINGIAMKLILTAGDSKLLERLIPAKQRSDHFTSEYWGMDLEIIDHSQSEQELRKAHLATERLADEKGFTIQNATMGGELEIYERVDLADIL